MATLQKVKQTSPAQVSKFLGINVGETGDTQIKLGESGNMTNFYITDDYKLKKMYGYRSLNNFNTPIRGIYGTRIGTVGYLLVATGGKLYYYLEEDLDDDTRFDSLTPTEIGSLVDTDCSFFEFDNKVYILSDGYYCWDGETFGEVEGYVPCVMISTTPNGSGTEYDDINMLTPKKHQTFNGDGTSKDYLLAQDNIDNVYKVKVNGNETTAYTVDKVNGKVTFTTAPSKGMDNVDIYWSKEDGDRHIIEEMRFGTVFGGDLDTRVFLYGNPTYPNRVYFSNTAFTNDIAVPSVDYFPAFNQVDVGPSNYAVTDLTRQYDRLLATTNHPEAYYLTISTEQLDVVLPDGSSVKKYVPSVGTFPLNEAHGNFAWGQGQVLNNYPVTIDKTGFTIWKATNVRDEKNIQNISGRIQMEISKMNMELFRTLERQADSQMWFANGYNIYIYNYANDTYSRIKIAHEINGFTEVGKKTYMSTEDGQVMQWSEELTTYDGETIKAHWEMNFSDFDAFYLRKTMRKLWVQMQPSVSSSAEIGYITNLMTSPTRKRIAYAINGGFDNVDFANYSFQMSVNPQPFRLKLKAKKFTNMKITIDNNENTACTILALAMKVESFGESK